MSAIGSSDADSAAADGSGHAPGFPGERPRLSGLRYWPLLCALLLRPAAYAGQDASNEAPPPASAKEAATPLQQSFPEKPVEAQRAERITDEIRKVLQDMPPFVRDTALTFKPRTYYFYQEQPDGTLKEAWALGGSLEYRSGWLAERVRIGAEVYTSQPLYAPPDRDGTLLLAPGQQGYTVLGQAYGDLRLADSHLLTAGAREYSTPYVNRQFNRMTPNSFEGITLKGSFYGPLEHRRFDYLVGYLSEIKQRNGSEFVPMSSVLNPTGPSEGTYLAQALFTVWGTSIGLSNYYTADNLNIFYAETAWDAKLSAPYGLKLSAQYTNERAVGESLASRGARLSGNIGAEAILSYQRSALTLAYSKTSSDGNVLSPWGSNPSFTIGAIKNTNRAGEQSALAQYSYGFSGASLAGLSLSALYAYSWDAIVVATGARQKNEHELDLSLDYRVPTGALKGLWFRLQRNGLLGEGDPEATKETRVIFYWEIPLM
jgi:hypothetical protein